MALRLRPGRTAKRGVGAPAAPATPADRAARARGPAGQATQPAPEKPELLGEVLIEEVSIDGMCGVY